MQTAIVIIIVVAALLFMARRMQRQWKGDKSCGCGNNDCTCGKNDSSKRHPDEGAQANDKHSTSCYNCPLHDRCDYCQ